MSVTSFLRAIVVAATMIAAASSASAITFDFRNAGPPQHEVVQTVGGVTLTVEGFRVVDPYKWWKKTTVSQQDVTQTHRGLGVGSHHSPINTSHSWWSYSYEYLLLTFDRTVTLASAEFDGWWGKDHKISYKIFNLDPIAPIALHATSSVFDFGSASNTTGSTFAIFAKGKHSKFYLSEVSIVPLPAGALLLISGLGAFTVLRRRQQGVTATA